MSNDKKVCLKELNWWKEFSKGAQMSKKQPFKERKWSKGMFIGAQMTKKIFRGSLMGKNNVWGRPNDEK